MKKIKISIIATFYNLEDYVRKCVNSLTQQTLKDIEIICVNDGSTDNTIKILQKLAEQDNRIKIIDKKNEGVSIARNTGIQAASGDYIMFVDGDDYLELNACEILYQKAIETNVDLISFQRNLIKANTLVKDTLFYPSNKIKNKPYFFYDKIEETFKYMKILCWDKLYKRNIIQSNNIKFPKNLNYGEDSIFLFYCLEINPQILIIEDYLYNYTVSRENSLTAGMDKIKQNKYSTFSKIVKCINYINNNLTTNKLLKLHSVNRFFYLLINICSNLYFTQQKQEYINFIKQILELYKDFDKKTVEKMNGYKLGKRYLQMDKYHLLGVYLSIIRPIGKYLIVKPYRFIKTN